MSGGVMGKQVLLLAMFLLVMENTAVAENQSEKPSAKAEILLTANAVQQLLESGKTKDLILLDCRGEAIFAKGHLPGARWVDVPRWRAAALEGNGAGLHGKDVWQRMGRELGLSRDARLVVYGGPLPSTARIWWLLKYLGCRHVSLLDGGITAWKRAGQPTTQRVVEVASSQFQPEFQPQRLAGIEEVKRSKTSDGVTIFDTRSDGEFADGRVPNSVHLAWTQMLTKQGTFQSREELRQLFQPFLSGPEKTAITYCQSGARASVEVFALEWAGYKNVKNYYCSWQQYSKDKTAEVEK